MVDGEHNVASLALCHSSVILFSCLGCIIVIEMGHCRAVINHCAIGSIPGGHWKVPFSTWLNALADRLASVNISNSGDFRNDVWDACVNHLPTSAKHKFSNSAFVFDSIHCIMSSGCGPITWFSPCLVCDSARAALIILALLWIFLVVWIFFHSDFFETFWSCACALMSCTIHMSLGLYHFSAIDMPYRPAVSWL